MSAGASPPEAARRLEVLADEAAVAERGAAVIADAARAAVAARGRFAVAVSGGRTPWVMLAALARADLPWPAVHVAQVDERAAPADSPERNLKHLRDSLLSKVPIPPANLLAMPVEDDDLAAGARAYAASIAGLAGSPPVFDLVHLGLGPDGHTASLVPGDPVLAERSAFVAATGIYQGVHRMTLTYPVLDAARCVLFVVTGAEKAPALARLMRGDPGIPAGRVAAADMRVLADRAAAAEVANG